MKKIRRLLSIVLAMVMVLSMNVAAFAEESTLPKIVVTIDTEDVQFTQTYTAAAGITLEAAVRNYVDLEQSWSTVDDWEIEGVTHQVLDSLRGMSTTAAPSNNATKNLITSAGYDFQEWVSGYTGYARLVSTASDPYPYHYLYAGYGWTYTSNLHMTGDEYDYISSYMCCYTLSENETIYLTYKLSLSPWYTATPLA